MGEMNTLDEVLQRAQHAAMQRICEPEVIVDLAAEDRRRRLETLGRSGCRVDDDVLELIADGSMPLLAAGKAIREWHESKTRRPWLVLSGTTGCGKSVSLAGLLSRVRGRYMRAQNICNVFAAMFGEQLELQQQLRDTSLLAIDDVGTELDSTRMLAVLLDLLDSRKSARNTPTIATTNLSRKAFAELYPNERLMSRMAESVQWVALNGEDLRRKK